MPKAYSYIRFSTPEQARGDSLRRQMAKAEAWCEERGLALDDTLQDLGVSAYHGANRATGALRRFLELVEEGEIERGSYLIVESLDRLSREAVIDAASRLFDLIRGGIVVVTLSDGQEYSSERLRNDWTPLVISLAVMARAHDESRIKSERVGEAWRRKKEAARAERRPLTKRCPEWLELRDGHYAERPDRVAVVRRIYRETIEGAGRREIVRRLNAEGIPPFRGGDGWHTSSVAKIIQSRAVLGEYQPHSGTHKARTRKPEGDPIPDFYPAILDGETFWRAQAATQGRRQRAAGRKGTVGAHILQGLARCGACGGAMHIINKGPGPRGGVYLRCSSALRHAGCSSARRWRARDVERSLVAVFANVHSWVLAPKTSEPAARERLVAAQARLADAEARRDRLLAMTETGDDAAARRFAEVASEVQAIRRDLKTIASEAAQAEAAPDLEVRVAHVAGLLRQLDSDDEAALRDLRIRLAEALRQVVERVECHDDLVLLIPKGEAADMDGGAGGLLLM